MIKQAILCVDDEAILLFALVQELKKGFGDTFIYEKASDAENAFQIIGDLAQDGISLILIISDWLMPGIKGDAFLEIVNRNNPGVKSILITGHADNAAIDKVKSNPSVIAVLKKPWNALELQNIIRENCLEGC